MVDWSGSQLRNNLETDEAVRGKMKLVHLNATKDSWDGTWPLFWYQSRIGFLRFFPPWQQYAWAHQSIRPPPTHSQSKMYSLPSSVFFFQYLNQYPILFSTLTSLLPLLRSACFHLTTDKWLIVTSSSCSLPSLEMSQIQRVRRVHSNPLILILTWLCYGECVLSIMVLESTLMSL